MKAVLFGFGAFLAYCVMVNMPEGLPVRYAQSAAGVVLLLLVVAYLGGRWHGRGRWGSSTSAAVAVSRSESQANNAVQVFTGPIQTGASPDHAAARRASGAAARVLPSGAVLLGGVKPHAVQAGGVDVRQDLSRGGVEDYAVEMLQESGAWDDGDAGEQASQSG